jgi:starch phosphorylase
MQLLTKLRESANDETFQREWAAVKRQAKVKAVAFIKELCGVTVSPDVMFDVQVRSSSCQNGTVYCSVS